MTSDCSYRKALPFDQARQEIVRLSGTQFSPEAVEILSPRKPPRVRWWK